MVLLRSASSAVMLAAYEVSSLCLVSTRLSYFFSFHIFLYLMCLMVECSFLQLIIPALPHVRLSSTDTEQSNVFWKHETDAIETLLLDFMLDVLLLPYK